MGTAEYWVTTKFENFGTAEYRVPKKFPFMPTPGPVSLKFDSNKHSILKLNVNFFDRTRKCVKVKPLKNSLYRYALGLSFKK